VTSLYAVTDPATGQLVVEYPSIGDEELRDAIGRAEQVAAAWREAARGAGSRAALVRRVGELHVERREELGRIIVREMGKPIEQALEEVDFVAEIYSFYAERAEKLTADEPIEVGEGQGGALIRRSPFGVLLGIMPWNYPTYQVARFAAPNLVIGNPILLKHAPQCPESALAIQRMFDDAGLIYGGYQNIFATNEQIESVIADPRVRGVSVTGSERAGAAVAEIAGRNLKKVVLELGGSDPFIVLGTPDLGAVVEAAVAARMENTGQACNAAKRFIVAGDIFDDFLTRFTAALGAAVAAPLSSSAAVDRLADQVERAVADGAEVVLGGERKGNVYAPTVLTGIRPGAPASQEEFFGPVAQVYRVTSEAEAVALANDTPFGLGSYVMTDDPEQAERVADLLDVGMVFVNAVSDGGPELPFGGTKRSGFGRELGLIGAEEFVNKKVIKVGRLLEDAGRASQALRKR
jgi:succinate-semialdehyde dehydrogenase / glutarate-semialdehyde dehydrogenase